ncbi:MAG: hypothetical protein GWN99_04690 [Gemmatimonadetes bacterium]|uniref:Glycosyl transferase family 28 C-terminal domain-containing protein n=1 Tax=Candidatus Kutchimonas denitrificans TaxID=3056748 RepID=A0AAE4Z9X0_9BACT|nr:hypothetical protein [Gemmatimonadota bacterium]NIR75748.1 hypothetical protein [Candidatus Kutchimonas denitrificans]NIS00361.1 hypothetical protein [Gemmatimonadota bacterium]NIT66020.1 hypothetical protein [Gemmatimonadota bacterium]NIU53724.1 hypothetical protein [Gemmatimonadota bacterium]
MNTASRPEPSEGGGPRIAVFTHDAYGVGHVRRCLHIVQGLAAREPEAAMLLVTGSPALELLRTLPPNADYVKIPTIVTSGTQGTRPPVLPLGLAELSLLRRQVIRETVLSFAPDVFLVDNFPLGSRLELLPTLKELRRIGTRVALGLRDIADPPDKVRRDWARAGIYEVLDRYYDRILIYGVPEVLDAGEAYALSARVAAKIRYCGYVTAASASNGARDQVRAELGVRGPLLLATVGGGGDGFPLLEAVLRAVPLVPDLTALVVTGEFMSAVERDRLATLAGTRRDVLLRHYLRDLPTYMAAADVVVSMSGYNTTAEILATGCPAVVVPRTWRSGEHAKRERRAGSDAEQLVRAKALADAGVVDLLNADGLSPETLAQRITAALSQPRRSPNGTLNLRGQETVVRHLLDLARPRER